MNIDSQWVKEARLAQSFMRTGQNLKAHEAFSNLANKGAILGKIGLAHSFINGIGVDVSIPSATKLLLEYSSSDTFYLLYVAGFFEARNSLLEAEQFYSKAAQNGSAIGLYRLGMYQKWGIGGLINSGDSFENLYLAAACGNAWGKREIASIYMSGSFGVFYRVLGFFSLFYIVPHIVIVNFLNRNDLRIKKNVNPFELEDPIEFYLSNEW